MALSPEHTLTSFDKVLWDILSMMAIPPLQFILSTMMHFYSSHPDMRKTRFAFTENNDNSLYSPPRYLPSYPAISAKLFPFPFLLLRWLLYLIYRRKRPSSGLSLPLSLPLFLGHVKEKYKRRFSSSFSLSLGRRKKALCVFLSRLPR